MEDTMANLVFKRKALVKLFNDGKEAFKNKDMYKAGESYGKLMYIVLHPPSNEEAFMNSFVQTVPINVSKCTHAEKDAQDLIDVTQSYLDGPAKKGQVNNITIQGNMKEYQDLEKVTIKTYFHGVRLDKRDAPNEQSVDAGEEMTFKYGAEIPKIAPSATYDLQMEFKNVDGKVVKCVAMQLSFWSIFY